MELTPEQAQQVSIAKRHNAIFGEIRAERARQDDKWGPDREQPNGTGRPLARALDPDVTRRNCERAFAEGRGTWYHILAEEVGEAFAESDPVRLRAELVQVAAVAVAWIDNLDRTRMQRALDAGVPPHSWVAGAADQAGADVDKPKVFRERNPKTVEAMVWTGTNLGELLTFVNNVDVAKRGDRFCIEPGGGSRDEAIIGDYVVRDTRTGRFYVMDNVEFADFFVPVEPS